VPPHTRRSAADHARPAGSRRRHGLRHPGPARPPRPAALSAAPPTIVATDVSPRALFTRINALLNDAEGIDTRRGSLFEPVAGEQFDRVVSNPPFVITPRVAGVPEYEYRDAGYAGDDLVAAFVSGVGAVLAPGGTAQLLGNWEYRAGQDGLQRVREWVAASPVPLEAWVIERERLDPSPTPNCGYATAAPRRGRRATARSSTRGSPTSPPARSMRSGSATCCCGARHPRFPRWPATSASRTRCPRTAPSVRTWAPRSPPSTLSRSRRRGPRRRPHDRRRRRHRGASSSARRRSPERHRTAPGRRSRAHPRGRPALAALVGASDGELTVGQLSDAIAELLEVDAAALRADLLPRVRELVFIGMLRLA
jgi:hypothetical protein